MPPSDSATASPPRSPAPLVIESVRDLDGLAALAAGWDDLVRAMPRPSPFLLHGWIEEWWRSLGAGAELAVVTARRGEALVGVLPLYVSRRRGVRVARFLGGHESALGDVLLADPADDEVGRALLEALEDERFSYVDLFGLPAGSALARFVPADRLTLLERVEAPVMLMPDGWDAAYTAKTSSKKRALHRRRARQLGELGAVEFTVARTLEELRPALEAAFEIHSLRWRGRPDASTFGQTRGREFHRRALERIARDDVPRIVTLSIAGRPVAFHYYFALAGTMYVHRLAFDPDLARMSPGQVTTLETLRAASDEGLTRVEFLGGDERYKLELADGLEPMSQALGLARDPLGFVAAQGTVAMIETRKRLKRSERLHRLYLQGLGPVRRASLTLLRRTPAD